MSTATFMIFLVSVITFYLGLIIGFNEEDFDIIITHMAMPWISWFACEIAFWIFTKHD